MLADKGQVAAFLLTAIVVAYPTVWLATGARGRYFMPIYPLVAVLIGMLVESLFGRRIRQFTGAAWHQFVLAWALLFAVGAIIVAGVGLLPGHLNQSLYQPRLFCLGFAAVAAAAVAVLWLSYRRPALFGPCSVVLAIVAVAGLGASGAMVNVNASRWYDPTNFIAEIKTLLPADASLVSLTPIDHRFAYYYRTPITELDWPRTPSDLPPNVDYFCFMRHVTDTAESRMAGRGRTWLASPGTLPFAWEELRATSVDRNIITKTATIVVLGRVVRPLRGSVGRYGPAAANSVVRRSPDPAPPVIIPAGLITQRTQLQSS